MTDFKENYSLTPEQAKKLRNCRLTAAEWKVWSYLIFLGDEAQFCIRELMISCKVCKTTAYSAILTLETYGLFKFDKKYAASIKNLSFSGETTLNGEEV